MTQSTSRAVLYIAIFVISSGLLMWSLLGDNDLITNNAHIIDLREKIMTNVQNNSLWNSLDPSTIMKVMDMETPLGTHNQTLPIVVPVRVNSPVLNANVEPSLDFDTTFLSCENQSQCIPPRLQLATTFKVYMCKHTASGGVRFYYLARDGLLLHPNIIMVDNLDYETIDFIIYLPNSSPWAKTECNNTAYAKKLIVLEEFDGPLAFAPFRTKEERMQHYPVDSDGRFVLWNYLFFKRSYVKRNNGVLKNYPHLNKKDVFPMTYSIANAYIPHRFNQKRDTEILCTLRGSEKQLTRLWVQNWVAEYIAEKGINTSTSGEIDGASRRSVSLKYFQKMTHAQIVVTVNPGMWEGDFRLWEAMSTGALVFVDPIMVPHPFPLLDKMHLIHFSIADKSDLLTKLDYYREHKEEAQAIALRGYEHAMKYHRTTNFIDYVFITAHTKMGLENPSLDVPQYKYTGQYLVAQTKAQLKAILSTGVPGHY